MPTQTLAEVEAIRARFLLLAEPPTVIDFRLEIVASHDLQGKRIHDAHAVGLHCCQLTFNAADFPPDPGVTIPTPPAL